jgi:hypothetical protein
VIFICQDSRVDIYIGSLDCWSQSTRFYSIAYLVARYYLLFLLIINISSSVISSVFSTYFSGEFQAGVIS